MGAIRPPTKAEEIEAKIKYFRGEEVKWRETAGIIAEKEGGEAAFAAAWTKADEFGAKARELETAIPEAEIGMPEVKEPWQMTKEEYVKSAREWRAENMPRLIGRALEDELEHVAAGHMLIVQNALGLGKPVPPEVLADYPDLVAKGKEENPPPIKARGRIFWTRESTDERIKILKKLGLEQEPYWAQPWDKLPSHYKEAIAIYYSTTYPELRTREGNPTMLASIVAAQTVFRKEEERKRKEREEKAKQAPGLLWGKRSNPGGNPMTPEEIDQIATKVAAKVLEDITPSVLDPVGRGLLLHFTEHEMVGAGMVVNEAKARASPCNCFTYKDREYCFSPGVIGMMSSKEKPEQIAEYCGVGKTYEVKPGIKQRFESFAGAAEEAHKKIEEIPKGERLVPWLTAMGEELEKRGIEV